MLIVHRQLRDDFWTDPSIEDEPQDETAASSFLQISANRVHSGERLDAEPRRSGAQYVNLQHSIKEFEVFDSHFFMPDLDLEIGPWHSAYHWLLDWWDFATPGHTLWIYYDGSYIAHEASATAAAAAFLQVDDHWQFAGVISTKVPLASDSYDAEHFASAISLKLAYDILKLHEAVGASTPEVHFCSDSLTVGHQTSGIWSCFKHPLLGQVLRNIHRLIETRFCPNIPRDSCIQNFGRIPNLQKNQAQVHKNGAM
jgi:hypothetical protein